MADAKAAESAGPPNAEWPLKDKEGFVTVPFAYGSIAFWQGKRAGEFQTHKWHIYLRGANNEDLTPLIERVIFQLHPSFNNPTRVIDQAPFHVSELGWGEFEVIIRVFFRDGPETGIELRHHLALFPKTGEPSMKRPVVAERHDEFVFNQPTDQLLSHIHLVNSRLVNAGPAWAQIEPHFSPVNEHEELLRIQAAQQRVHAEAQMLKEEYQVQEQGFSLLSEEMRKLDAAAGGQSKTGGR
mmetsp:Transcript_53095/g.126329  ORF Transcript_53095/g.126329 Transcript_53095/m.126329 type:complete len:240 (+) Transcript_53095:24-743(+)|eukprot:CAMPEP_0180139674 /NCGR_PEP_ID=MMETSP0986-20121125/13703_1 /TAXON_ID=697907 /ORGANISM="non described non described, Strain CCMP2293" /LENGTH=239 /DNA_ID=CAMNT_0022081881 /DNA_START=18 /DNA_END=737 /DNA_ORIENTATION=+